MSATSYLKHSPRSCTTRTIHLVLMLALSSSLATAGMITDDPMGFYGIQWGHSLADLPQFIKVDSQNDLSFYRPKESAPTIWGIPVTSLKFVTVHDQFAQATIHYQGEKNHLAILNHLRSEYGEIARSPGSMMRGLNQQHSWRGTNTEISITYHGLTERGFMAIQSRVLAAELMNSISDQSF